MQRFDQSAVHASVDDAVWLQVLRTDLQLSFDLARGGSGDGDPHRLRPPSAHCIHLRREILAHPREILVGLEKRRVPGNPRPSPVDVRSASRLRLQSPDSEWGPYRLTS